MRLILELTETGWKKEIAASGLPEKTKELLSAAVQAKIVGNRPFPVVSESEFEDIVCEQVFFLRIGSKGFILNINKRNKNNPTLVLQKENSD